MRVEQRPPTTSLIRRAGRYVYDWLEERYPLTAMINRLLFDPVPKKWGWLYGWGGALVILFAMQIITGILLVASYVPSWNEAYNSIKFIDNTIAGGYWIRGLHFWNAYMILFIMGVHIARTFFSGAYKKPRELTWVVGVFIMICMILVAYTGAGLRMDETGYWTIIIGEHIAGWTPVIGPLVQRAWLGSDRIGPSYLTRTFAVHIWILPALLIILISIHVAFVIIQGQYGSWLNYTRGDAPDRALDALHMPEGDERESYLKALQEVNNPNSRKRDLPDDTDYFVPEHAFRESMIALICLIVEIVLTAIAFNHLDAPADPGTTTFVPVPEWFMLPADQMLPYLPGTMVPLIPVAFTWFVAMLIGLPFFDRGPERNMFKRPVALSTGIVVVLSIFLLTMLGGWRIMSFGVH
jgi:quinol-cytochrome oxidoreductase complex cytochrome b subunit